MFEDKREDCQLKNGRREKNLDILIPFKDEKQVPDYLIDFI